MRYAIIAALALALFMFFGGSTPTTVSAECGADGKYLNDLAYWQIANGNEDCQDFYANQAELAACREELKRVQGRFFKGVSPAWWGAGLASDGTTVVSTACPTNPYVNFGLHPCMDWQTSGPGTGHGVDPAVDISDCQAWELDAFYNVDEQPKGVSGSLCDGLTPTDCVQAKSLEREAQPEVTLLPPSAGDGGLLGTDRVNILGIYVLIGAVSSAVLVVLAVAYSSYRYARN